MLKSITTAFLFIGAVFLYIRYIEQKSIFVPFKNIVDTPEFINLTFEDIFFDTSDGVTLNGWYIPAKNSNDTLLFFHGNGGNISHRLEKCSIFNSIGVNIFIIDYRGYGKSSGRPNEVGLYKDAQSSFDYLIVQKKIKPENIIVYGESLGGACAVEVAYKNPVKALILDSTFTSTKDMAKTIYPFLPSFLFLSKFDLESKVKNISSPKLFMHSINDEIVPFSLGEKLFNSAREPKEFIKIKGGHNTNFVDSRPIYISSIEKFINSLK